jgi:hypothetical protein
METEKIVKIEITPRMKEEAITETMKDLKNMSKRTKRRFTFQKLYIGTLGQKCVEKLLRENNIIFQTDATRMPGRGDRFDIKSGSYLIEVKIRSHDQENLLIIPKRQIDRNIFNYYIGVKLDQPLNYAFVHGYAYSGEIRTSTLTQSEYGYWYHFSFERLNPIQELIVNLPTNRPAFDEFSF